MIPDTQIQDNIDTHALLLLRMFTDLFQLVCELRYEKTSL